jgi:hypothetical protein
MPAFHNRSYSDGISDFIGLFTRADPETVELKTLKKIHGYDFNVQ